MTKRTFSMSPATSRVLAAAVLALTGVAHAQQSAPRDLPPYLPPESSTAADAGDNADAKKAAGAKSDSGKTPAPRVLAPRGDAKAEAARTPNAKASQAATVASDKKSGGTARSETASATVKSSGSSASTRGAAASAHSIAPATPGASSGAPKTRATGSGSAQIGGAAATEKRAPLAPSSRAAASTFSASELPPSQLPFRQLGEGWQRVIIVAPTLTTAPNVASTQGTQNVVAQRVAQLYGGESGVFFTRGETLQTGSETFLALYKMRVSPAEIAALFPKSTGNADAATRALTAFFANRPLELSLVNVRNIGAMRDIKPFSQAAQTAQLRAIFGGAPATSLSATSPAASTRGSAYYASLARTNLLRLGGALDLYARAHGGTLPPLQNFEVARKALLPYAGRLAFTHPAPNARFVFNPILSGRKIVHIAQPRDMISAYEVPPSGAKRAVLFLDGTVRFLDAAQWRKYSRGSKIK